MIKVRTKFNLKNAGIFFLAAICFAACSKPLTKEEASKKIISDLMDNCKASKNEAAGKIIWDIMPQKEKERRLKGDKFDYTNQDHKMFADRFCGEFNSKYGSGYEFGNSETQGDMIAWKVFPTGKNEGSLFAFKPLDEKNEKFELVDVDPAKR